MCVCVLCAYECSGVSVMEHGSNICNPYVSWANGGFRVLGTNGTEVPMSVRNETIGCGGDIYTPLDLFVDD